LESKLGIDKNPESISRTGTGTGIDQIQTIPNPTGGDEQLCNRVRFQVGSIF